MRFLPCFAFAMWLPHIESHAGRWLVMSAFVCSLLILLRGLDKA